MTELNPYRKELIEGTGCEHCGHAKAYDVVLVIPGEEETALSTSYEDEEFTDDLVEELNTAFERGRKYDHDH